MKINFQNTQYNYRPNFEGRGIDIIQEWQKNPMRLDYYKDIANDLAEGAKLYFEKNKDIDDSVKKLHSFGGLTIIFDIPNSEILKISLENPLEFRKHNPDFDIPFLSEVEKFGKTYIVRQPKADTKNITQEHWLDVVKRIYNGLCELSKDGNKFEQYGLYNGKAYLIDTRCAMPLPNTYTMIVDQICRKINKCYTYLNKEQAKIERETAYKNKGYFSYHIDETPRRSLSFSEGIKKIYVTLKNNIKYRKNNYCIPYEEYKSQNLKISRFIEL